MENTTTASALAGFTAKLNAHQCAAASEPEYGQGTEMSPHADLAANMGIQVYFCDPHSTWQRGTCEYTNGLLRQYILKGPDLPLYSQVPCNTQLAYAHTSFCRCPG